MVLTKLLDIRYGALEDAMCKRFTHCLGACLLFEVFAVLAF